MKSILTFILATFLLFPLQAQEKVYTVDNLPKSSPAKQNAICLQPGRHTFTGSL